MAKVYVLLFLEELLLYISRGHKLTFVPFS